MLKELTTQNKVVGVKQSRKAIAQERALKVFLAVDADPMLLDPLRSSCGEKGIPVIQEFTCAELGRACQISVGAAIVAVVRE